MPTAALEVNGLRKRFGPVVALRGASFSVAPGEVFGYLGPNGAGKTTTLRSIMGIVPPRLGRITFAGQELRGLPIHAVARAGVAYVPEERRILPNLTVEENLRLGRLGADGRRGEGDAAMEEVLAYFPRLRERLDQKGKGLSGGEQQMLAIARGLIARPRLMLVDEPTEGLSPIIVESLTEILRAINRRGTAILLVEQILEVALALSHRLYVMDQGRIQFEGSADQLRADPAIQQRFLGV